MKMEPAAACTATITTSIHEEKSKGSRKAVAEMIPVLLETRMVIPVSKNGTEKSITDSLNEIMVRNLELGLGLRLLGLDNEESNRKHGTIVTQILNLFNFEHKDEENSFFSRFQFPTLRIWMRIHLSGDFIHFGLGKLWREARVKFYLFNPFRYAIHLKFKVRSCELSFDNIYLNRLEY